MQKQGIECSKCEYCWGVRKLGNTRSEFFCNHPNKEHIREYYKQHKITKMEGFIGFGERWSHEVPIKSSPKWCPRKLV